MKSASIVLITALAIAGTTGCSSGDREPTPVDSPASERLSDQGSDQRSTSDGSAEKTPSEGSGY